MNVPAEGEAAADSCLCSDAKAPVAEADCPRHRKDSSHAFTSVDARELNLRAQIPAEPYFALPLQSYQAGPWAQAGQQFSGTLVLHVRQGQCKHLFQSALV